MKISRFNCVHVVALALIPSSALFSDQLGLDPFPYSTDSLADFSENTVSEPFWSNVKSVLSESEKAVAETTRITIARRTRGLPHDCLNPSHVAYSENTGKAQEIVVCSNNFLLFTNFLTESIGMSMLKEKFMDNDIADKYLAYFASVVYRQGKAMRSYPTPIQYPCSYIVFYYLTTTQRSPDSCLRSSTIEGFEQWEAAQGGAISPDSYKVQRLVLNAATKSVNLGSEFANIEKAPDYSLWYYQRELLSRVTLKNLILFSVVHELGHLIHHDPMDSQDVCRIWEQEIAADRFASSTLVEMKYSDESRAFEGMMLLWYIYSLRLITLQIDSPTSLPDEQFDTPSKFSIVRTADVMVDVASSISVSGLSMMPAQQQTQFKNFLKEIKEHFNSGEIASAIGAASCSAAHH
jgi:hypothetical protein